MRDEYQIGDKTLRRAMVKAFDGKCFYSGRKVTEKDMEIDHVVPVAKGGKNSVFNYVLTTKEINRKKRDHQDIEAIDKILYIVKTAYAPKVLKILNNKKTILKHFLDRGWNKSDAQSMKKTYIDQEGYTLPQACVYMNYGFVLGGVHAAIYETDDVEELYVIEKDIKDMLQAIKNKIVKHSQASS